MLGKLIKHEFRATSRIIPLFFLAVLAAAIPTVIFNALNYAVMSVVFSSLLIFAGAALMFGSVIYLVIRFYKGIYGSEGYLTMTLPTGKNHVLLSHGIVASAWTLLASVCFTVSFYYAFRTIIYSAEKSPTEIATAMNMFSGGFMWFMLISAIIGNLTLLAEAYMCVTIAHVRPFRKLGLGASVLAYIMLYFVQSIVSLPLTMSVPPSLNYTPETGWRITNTVMFSSFDEMFSKTAQNSPMNMTIGVSTVFLSIVMLIVFYAVTSYLMKKKINIR